MKSYGERYPRLYKRLKIMGFSPMIALQILVDSRHGDRYALRTARLALKVRTKI